MLADLNTLMQDADSADARCRAHLDNEARRIDAGLETDLERYLNNKLIAD